HSIPTLVAHIMLSGSCTTFAPCEKSRGYICAITGRSNFAAAVTPEVRALRNLPSSAPKIPIEIAIAFRSKFAINTKYLSLFTHTVGILAVDLAQANLIFRPKTAALFRETCNLHGKFSRYR